MFASQCSFKFGFVIISVVLFLPFIPSIALRSVKLDLLEDRASDVKLDFLEGKTSEAALPTPASLNESFFLQWIGVQTTGVSEETGGVQQPRSPFSLKSRCLTVGRVDAVRGFSLSWQPCQNGQVKYVKFDKKARDHQLFKFTLNGKIKSNVGHCINRIPCANAQYTFDVAECSDEVSTTFRVKRPLANSLERMRDVGTPAEAVAAEEGCELCGPYQLVQRCSIGGGQGCRKNYMGPPGWTKREATYVGDAAVRGDQPPHVGFFDRLFGTPQWVNKPFETGGGLGRTEESGICGSYVTDGTITESFFYFVKASVAD